MYGLLMDTTANSKQTDSCQVMAARADEELAHAYEQITRAHEEIGRTEEQLSKLGHDAARHPSDHPQTRMNAFRPAVPSNRPSLGGRAARAFISLTLIAGIGARGADDNCVFSACGCAVACGDGSVATGLRVEAAVGRGGGADVLGRRFCSEALLSEGLAFSRDICCWLALSWSMLALSCSIRCPTVARSRAIDWSN